MEDKIFSKILKSIDLPSYIKVLLNLNGFRSIDDLKLLDEAALESVLDYVKNGAFEMEASCKTPDFIVKCLGKHVSDYSKFSMPFLDKMKLLKKLPDAIRQFESTLSTV